jgi:hypothetical protein
MFSNSIQRNPACGTTVQSKYFLIHTPPNN